MRSIMLSNHVQSLRVFVLIDEKKDIVGKIISAVGNQYTTELFINEKYMKPLPHKSKILARSNGVGADKLSASLAIAIFENCGIKTNFEDKGIQAIAKWFKEEHNLKIYKVI